MEQAIAQPTHEELLSENEFLKQENTRLKDEMSQLRRLIFGQKRERFVPTHPESQLEFWQPANDTPAVATEKITYNRKKKTRSHTPPSRNSFPAHLRREEIIIEPTEDVSNLKRIGEEITEELEYKPSQLYVNRYVRPKYAKPNDDGIVIGTLPSRPIDKGIPGPGLLAHVLISKYVDHLPLYRQRGQFRRQGVRLAESTLNDWVKASYELLLPLYHVQRQAIFRGDYLSADETPINVLDPNHNKGKCHRGYYWVYYNPLAKIAYFDYRPTRNRDGPSQLLQNFSGHLQVDGYTVYDDIGARDDLTLVGCFAHARRYFVEAQDSDRERAEWVLTRIQKLYQIERQAREAELPHNERYRLRQASAAPILHEIKTWLDRTSLEVLPKSAMGKAMRYMLKQWPKLEVYVTDGRLEIDNNLVENAIRPVALGRKNYLFAGSHEGAKRAALVYTLVATAKLHNLEPFSYLKDIIGRIADHPYKKLADLLPQNWRPSEG